MPPTPEEVLSTTAALAVGGTMIGYIVGVITGRCSPESPCPKCAFHVNEGRMRRYEADRARADEITRQQELRHDAAHKGFGWATGGPDKYNCADESCARNVKGRGMQ